jgi:hypothetical protein
VLQRAHHQSFAFEDVLMPVLRAALRVLTGWLRAPASTE